MPNRRDFLKTGALAGAGAMLAGGGVAQAIAKAKDVQQIDNSYTMYAAGTPPITKWTEAFIAAIPKAVAQVNPSYLGADYYELQMEGGRWQFHSQLPVTAPPWKFTTWQYRDLASGGWPGIGYLGPTIEVQTGTKVVIKFINNLPEFHPVQQSLDPTIPEVEIYGIMPGGRATPHLHGGFVDPRFDGHPHSWWTNKRTVYGNAVRASVERGTNFASLGSPGPNDNWAIYEYPNNQPSAGLWYHDHAMGVTRVNAYVGLAALYFIRDTNDTGNALNTLGVPSGAYEIPIVLQDKTFNADGSLFYPIAGVSAEHPIWMPEFFGDTPVINGRCYPIATVEPRRYRFRFVNGSQARFYNIAISSPKPGNIPLKIIGSEQGLLPAPLDLNSPLLPPATRNTFLIAPGERFDVIADFTGLTPGQTCMMTNDAKVPYPGGGGGPAIPQLMKFLIVPLASTDTSLAVPTLPPLNPATLVNTTPAVTREIVMKETLGPPLVGKALVPTHVRLNEKWFDQVLPDGVNLEIDETPKVGDVETWQYINLTVDAHPMHSHLVQFQVVNRQNLTPLGLAGSYDTLYLAWVAAGRPPATKPVLANFLVPGLLPPAGEETGWKDTVKVYPGQVTRVIAKYDLPPGVSPPAQYVYHCHILEHEENEMMRPFLVTSTGTYQVSDYQPRGLWKPGEKATASLPTRFALDQNYPNPFNPETTIRFSLPENSRVQLKVFNNLGQEVATLVDADYAAGIHAVNWNASNFASGVYFAKIKAGNFVSARRMTLVK